MDVNIKESNGKNSGCSYQIDRTCLALVFFSLVKLVNSVSLRRLFWIFTPQS